MTGLVAPATVADHPDHRRSLCLFVILPSGCAAAQTVTHPSRSVRHECAVLPAGTGWLSWTSLTATDQPRLRWDRGGRRVAGTDETTAMTVEVTVEDEQPVLALGPRTLRHPDGRLLVDEVLEVSWGRAGGSMVLAGHRERFTSAPALLVRRAGVVPSDLPPERPPAELPIRWWWWGTAEHPTRTWAASLDRARDGWPLQQSARICPPGGGPTGMDRVEVTLQCSSGGRVPTGWQFEARVRGAGQHQVTARAVAQLPAALLGGLGATWPLGTAGRGRSLAHVQPPHAGELASAHTFTIAEIRSDDHAQPGLAITELLAVGPHDPTGWSGFLTGGSPP